MILRTLSLLGILLSTAATAFQNTSPFFYFSTSQLPSLTDVSKNIIAGPALQKQLIDSLKACPSETYVLVSQPGVSISDYAQQDSAPNLRRWMKSEDPKKKNIQSRGLITEVVGSLDEDALVEVLKGECGANIVDLDASAGYVGIGSSSPGVIRVRFAPLPSTRESRAAKLRQNDSFLQAVISGLKTKSCTVMIATTSVLDIDPSAVEHNDPLYELGKEFADPLHQELKRDFSSHVRRADDNKNSSIDDLGLFEKYQFFTPGIFMGLLVLFMLLFICYVGISALSSLEISYGAFSKEAGPQAQKKQQ